MPPFNAGETLRERLLSEAHEWVRTKVPAHTRAEYEALLATNQDLAIKLIAKWRDLEELRAAYRELQYETAKQLAPMPTVIARAEVNRHVYHMETQTQLTWGIDPFRANFAVSDMNRIRDAAPCIVASFERLFHDKYVPALWAATEQTLWPTLARTAA